MKTTVQDLLFLNEDEAQELLDIQDPGFTVTVELNGHTIVKNPYGVVVLEIQGKEIK